MLQGDSPGVRVKHGSYFFTYRKVEVMHETPAKSLDVFFTPTAEIPDELKSLFPPNQTFDNPYHHPESLERLLVHNGSFSDIVWDRVFDSLMSKQTLPLQGRFGKLTLVPN